MAEWEIKLNWSSCDENFTDEDTKELKCGCQGTPDNRPLCQQSTCPKRVEEKTCEWILDFDIGEYTTKCTGDHYDVRTLHCPSCGGKIIIKEE